MFYALKLKEISMYVHYLKQILQEYCREGIDTENLSFI